MHLQRKHPPAGTGLMIDFSGGTTNAIYYVKIEEEITDQFPVPLPPGPGQIDMEAINDLRTILATASLRDAWHSGESYQRGLRYGQNHGRAYVGFSESLTRIPSDQLSDVAMKVMPWANKPEGVKDPLFYCDAVGINPKTSERGTTTLAVKLANLMASAQVIVDFFKSTSEETMKSNIQALFQSAPDNTAIATVLEVEDGQAAVIDLSAPPARWPVT
jgi:thiamine pyridinylase